MNVAGNHIGGDDRVNATSVDNTTYLAPESVGTASERKGQSGCCEERLRKHSEGSDLKPGRCSKSEMLNVEPGRK